MAVKMLIGILFVSGCHKDKWETIALKLKSNGFGGV